MAARNASWKANAALLGGCLLLGIAICEIGLRVLGMSIHLGSFAALQADLPGDSFAAAFEISQQDTFWSILEVDLAGYPALGERHPEVLNYGLGLWHRLPVAGVAE